MSQSIKHAHFIIFTTQCFNVIQKTENVSCVIKIYWVQCNIRLKFLFIIWSYPIFVDTTGVVTYLVLSNYSNDKVSKSTNYKTWVTRSYILCSVWWFEMFVVWDELEKDNCEVSLSINIPLSNDCTIRCRSIGHEIWKRRSSTILRSLYIGGRNQSFIDVFWWLFKY